MRRRGASWPVLVGVLAAGLSLWAEEPPAPVPDLQPLKGEGTGTLKGKIALTGRVPAGINPEILRVGDNRQLGNVMVWLTPPSGHYFPIDGDQLKEARKHPAEITVAAGEYRPHCAVHFAVYPEPADARKVLPTGQKCVVVNDDKLAHNLHWMGNGLNPKNRGANVILPAGHRESLTLVPDRLPVRLEDHIFPRMTAGWVKVLDHPYGTVSRSDTAPKGLQAKQADADFGAYEIPNIPAGVKVRVVAWHERTGWIPPRRRGGTEVEVKKGENVLDFEIKELDP